MLESEVFQTLKVFLIPILIVVTLLFFNENKAEKKRKLHKKKEKHSSDEFEENLNNYFGTNKDKNKEYEDEWNYDQDELEQLRIKIEEQQVENSKVYDVEAIGMLGFTQDQVDQTKLENEEAKFTCYVFDVTDENNEIPLQGLTDPYRDDKFLLQSKRNMKVGFGYVYNMWTPIFRFPVSLVIPPNRGKRKIKFVVSATKLKAEFENGKIKKKKDLYFNVETFFDLNFEEPGY